MADLSVLIAARSEEYLPHTIADVLRHAKGDTDIVAICDGGWPLAPIPNHPRLRLILPLEGGGILEHSHANPVSTDAAHAAKPAVIGQRAAVNLAAKLSTARFIMKLDAHCNLDDGFDVKLMAPYDTGEIGPDTTTIPAMINLHVFNWRCTACGRETYQGPKPELCEEDKDRDRTMAQMPPACGSTAGFEKVLVWQPRRRKAAGNGSEGRGGYARTEFWRVDHELHFAYHGPRASGESADAEIADVMSSVGACFFMRRERFWELDGLDESHGSWGSFGCEVALKSWLSGGRHVVNRRTWFSHAFRTQGRDWGFPYPMQPAAQDYARRYSQNLWRGNLWEKQTRPLSWLLEHFKPIKGWHQPDHSNETAEQRAQRDAAVQHVIEAGLRFYSNTRKGVVPSVSDDCRSVSVDEGESSRDGSPSFGVLYYSDCRGDARILQAVRDQIQRSVPADWPIVSVTLKPVVFGQNIVLPLKRGPLTMFRQILVGLEALGTDRVFFAEHDVLYHWSHFQFVSPSWDLIWYNTHRYQVSAIDGRAVHYVCCQTANLCADRHLLIAHYRKRIAAVEAAGGYERNMGYEAGTNKWSRALDGVGHGTWMAPFPNIDVRTKYNLSKTRWSVAEFRDKRTCEGWTESDDVPGWGKTLGRFDQFLAELARPVRTEGAA